MTAPTACRVMRYFAPICSYVMPLALRRMKCSRRAVFHTSITSLSDSSCNGFGRDVCFFILGVYHPRAIMSIGKYRNCHLTSAGAWGINKINRSKNRDNFTLQSFHIQASGTGSQMEQDTTRTAVYRCTQSRIQIVSSARKVVGLRSKYVRPHAGVRHC